MSDTLHKLARADAIPEGRLRCAEINGHRLLLAKVDGQLYCTDDLCTHEDASLCSGSIHGYVLKCPLHNGCFDVRDGRALEEPAEDDLRSYPVSVRDGDVFVEFGDDD
ncbi:MAG: non-heme iron oxygenase ferredoxin subunit [Gammaproteobacteria bacterium]|jgi:naphthalene 1,2-dioxygenase system ferredoxin subunit|nr:non-heme iron oxygenase ferredoxin subunit [Gammaproteobacteria bacterium]